MKGFVIGQIMSVEPVKKSKLSKTMVDIGEPDELQILTNAPVEVGQKVVVATIGTRIGENTPNPFMIMPVVLKNENSHGMFCGWEEVGVFNKDKGLIIPEGEIGQEFELPTE